MLGAALFLSNYTFSKWGLWQSVFSLISFRGHVLSSTFFCFFFRGHAFLYINEMPVTGFF